MHTQERAMYQIGALFQAYDGRIGRIVYTHMRNDAVFPNEQHIWIKCPNGSVVDAIAEYFKAVSNRPSSGLDQR